MRHLFRKFNFLKLIKIKYHKYFMWPLFSLKLPDQVERYNLSPMQVPLITSRGKVLRDL
jgi:hypothetical protein